MITLEQATALVKSAERQYDLEQQRHQRRIGTAKAIPEQLKQVAGYVFSSLTTMRPAWKVGFVHEGALDEKQVTAYKRQLLGAMEENGIGTMAQVEAGLQKLRAQPGQFLPSIGDFVQACKSQSSQHRGELNAGMYRIWARDRRLDSMTVADRRAVAQAELAKVRRHLQKGSV